MHLALSLYFFLAAASVEVLSFAPRATIGDVWGGINITQMVLQVSGVISSPTCNATAYCIQLTTQQIPMCLGVLGNPGCWCSNVNPVHYCAICMSNPTDNTTTPQQTQAAIAGHMDYHVGCNAYETFLNGTSTSTTTSSSMTSSSSSSSSSSSASAPTQVRTGSGLKSVSAGAIGGVVVGGLVGLALIGAVVLLLYRHMQNKHERMVGSTLSTSIFSMPQNDAQTKYPYGPGMVHTPSPILDSQRESVPYDTRILYPNI